MTRGHRTSWMVPPVLTALLTSATGVAINMATEWMSTTWTWVAVGVCTALTAVVGVWSYRGEHKHNDEPTSSAPSEIRQRGSGKDNEQLTSGAQPTITQQVSANDYSNVNMVGQGSMEVTEEPKRR